MNLLKKWNIILYGIASLLFLSLFFQMGEWFHIQHFNFKVTFFIIPFFGLATLPTAIYTKNVRQILFSLLLILCYFLLAAIHISLSNLFASTNFSLIIP